MKGACDMTDEERLEQLYNEHQDELLSLGISLDFFRAYHDLLQTLSLAIDDMVSKNDADGLNTLTYAFSVWAAVASRKLGFSAVDALRAMKEAEATGNAKGWQ
jgi:hypothetical protein